MVVIQQEFERRATTSTHKFKLSRGHRFYPTGSVNSWDLLRSWYPLRNWILRSYNSRIYTRMRPINTRSNCKKTTPYPCSVDNIANLSMYNKSLQRILKKEHPHIVERVRSATWIRKAIYIKTLSWQASRSQEQTYMWFLRHGISNSMNSCLHKIILWTISCLTTTYIYTASNPIHQSTQETQNEFEALNVICWK